jgi:hypothetical protein
MLLGVACGGSKEAPAPQPQPPAEPAAEPPAEPAAEAEEEPSAEEVPVTADFEEEAEQDISLENYVAELDRLEAELAQNDSE